ncbi:MAG: hypothetical protein LBQ35_06190 [Spirochaetaceae bacterium]|jgi:hypothetical protein|nr:hypothetical protein [Spirochaetaceae bacterium]
MKKALFLSALLCCGAALFAQQDNEPVYVNHFLVGPYVCEFAENGMENEEMKELEPFIRNGRLYFLSPALPAEDGNLRPGVQFILSPEHTVFGVYQGRQTEYVSSDTGHLFVAGFAEAGRIIVTHVFPDNESLENWVQTARLAYYY